MKKDKFMEKAFIGCLDKLGYIIAACEFDEERTADNRLLNRLYVAQDLIELVEKELKRIGAI